MKSQTPAQNNAQSRLALDLSHTTFHTTTSLVNLRSLHHTCSHRISHHTSRLTSQRVIDSPHRLRFTTLGPIHRSLPSPRTLIALDRSLPSLIALEPRPCLCLLLGCPRRSSDPCQSARVEKLPHPPTQGLCSSHWASSAITNRQHKRGEGAGKKERERRSGGLLSHGE